MAKAIKHSAAFVLYLLTLNAHSQSVAAVSPVGVAAVPPPASTSATVSITVSPRVIPPVGGKLPSSMNVVAFEKDCNDQKGTDLKQGNYSLMITGSGLTFSATQNKSKCAIAASLSIDANTPAGNYSVVLLDGTGAPVASADLAVMDSSAGGIPPGLAPQVDVLWEVMSQNSCSDVFGRRVGQGSYCVQVAIGNNSGHPLQLAGIGFTNRLEALAALGNGSVTIANNSYASTRAVLLREETWNGRNVLYHSIEAAGLLMAGFTPYFSRPNAKAHFATAASIVSGPLLQAMNLIAPDPIVAQLNNLDDQSLRDNIVISNNAQIRTVVFVDKQALSEALQELRMRLGDAAAAAQTKAKSVSTRDESAKHSADLNAKILSTIANDAQGTVRNSTRPRFLKGSQNPLLVKLALGCIVIVGDEIEYLQRVQVQNNAASPSAVSVTISPVSADLGLNATQQFTATVTGSSNTAVTWSVNDVQGGNTTFGAISATGLYTAPAALPNPNPVTVKATSTADAKQFASATVTIDLNPISVSVTPATSSLAKSATQQFTSTVAGAANTAVNWSVNGVSGGNVTVGTISASGLYTAPSTAPANPVTVTATSAADATKSGSATVTVQE